jgi:superfamily II RNA helicase
MAKVLGFQINIQGTEQSIQTAEQLKRAIAELQKELKKAGDVETITKLEEQLTDLKARQQEVNATIRDEIKLRRQELTAVDDVSGTYDKLSKTLNEQRKRYKDLAAAGKESSTEAIKLRGDINELDKQLKKIDANVGQFQRNVGGYTQALEQFFPRISSGIGQVTNGFKAAQGAAGGFNKALGFISLAVTVITGIIDALQSAKETAREFTEIQGRLAQTTDLSKLAIQEQSATIVALSRTYEASTNEILNAANTLSKEFGISLGNSLELIEAGFRKGANAQGDFIDQLREYPAQFAAAEVKPNNAFAAAMAATGNPQVSGVEASAEAGNEEAALAGQILAAFSLGSKARA